MQPNKISLIAATLNLQKSIDLKLNNLYEMGTEFKIDILCLQETGNKDNEHENEHYKIITFKENQLGFMIKKTLIPLIEITKLNHSLKLYYKQENLIILNTYINPNRTKDTQTIRKDTINELIYIKKQLERNDNDINII